MKKTISHNSAIKSDGISIRENDLVTKAYQIQGLDLVIEQNAKNKKPVYLAHYSNPGTTFFTGLVKFLYVHKMDIPKVKAPKEVYDEFSSGAQYTGLEFAIASFPIEYRYHYCEGAYATLQPTYKDSNPSLEVKVNNQSMLIYPKTAQTLIENIPLMYPRFDSFYKAYTAFLGEAEKHPEQLIDLSLIRGRKESEQQ